jgi:hypothetical protein
VIETRGRVETMESVESPFAVRDRADISLRPGFCAEDLVDHRQRLALDVK